MNPVRDTVYWAKRVLLGLYGPATQDPATDPVEALKREHGESDAEYPPKDDAVAAGEAQAAANAGEMPEPDSPPR